MKKEPKLIKSIQDLYEKYPKIFYLMKKGYYAISSGVFNTWLQTLDWLCGTIQERIDNRLENNKHLDPIPQVVCQQVKEKFGGLRFYYSGGDKEITGMIDMAEHILWETCENCGSHENITTTEGWIARICNKCIKNKKK